MVPTKKTTKRLAFSAALALITLTLCVDNFIAALHCQTTSWLHLPVNNISQLTLTCCYFGAQIFLIVSIIRYHKQSHIPKKEENWTKGLSELLDDTEDSGLGITLRTLICTQISMHKGDLQNYYERNDMIDIIEERIKECKRLTLSDGTTYTLTFDPCKKKQKV